MLSLSQASREQLAVAAAAAAAAGVGGGAAASGGLHQLNITTTTPPSSSPPSPTRSVASSAAGFPSPEPVAVSFLIFLSFFLSFFGFQRGNKTNQFYMDSSPLLDQNRIACASSTRCFLTRRERK